MLPTPTALREPRASPKPVVGLSFSGPSSFCRTTGAEPFPISLAARTQQDSQEKGHSSGSDLDGHADLQHVHHLLTGQDFALSGEAPRLYEKAGWPSREDCALQDHAASAMGRLFMVNFQPVNLDKGKGPR